MSKILNHPFNGEDKQTVSWVLAVSWVLNSSSRELFSNGQIVTGVRGLHGNLSVHPTSRWPLPIRLTHNKQDPPRLSHFTDASVGILFPFHLSLSFSFRRRIRLAIVSQNLSCNRSLSARLSLCSPLCGKVPVTG